MENRTYLCICGKVFDNPQKFNGHKSNCKMHSVAKYGSEDTWISRRNQIAEQAPLAFNKHSKICKEVRDDNLCKWKSEEHVCEFCGKVMVTYYGSGRFCNKSCARAYSTKAKRIEINQKVSKKLTGRSVANGMVKKKSPQSVEKQQKSIKKTLNNKFKDTLVRCHNGDILDITKSQLEEYRKLHPVCEICGKSETTITFTGSTGRTKPNRLCVDHNHATNKFRGLLCQNCNSRLGWYENNKDSIDLFLQRGL